MKTLTTFSLLTILLLAGCSAGTRQSSNSSANVKTAENNPPKDITANSNPPKPDLPTSSITGVASCDEYLNRVEFCLTKPNVPDAMKSAYRQSMEQNSAAWKQAASTPAGKEQLESSCKMALDAARSFFETCK